MSRLLCRPAARRKQTNKRIKLKGNEEKRSEKDDLLVQEVDEAPALVHLRLCGAGSVHKGRVRGPVWPVVPRADL